MASSVLRLAISVRINISRQALGQHGRHGTECIPPLIYSWQTILDTLNCDFAGDGSHRQHPFLPRNSAQCVAATLLASFFAPQPGAMKVTADAVLDAATLPELPPEAGWLVSSATVQLCQDRDGRRCLVAGRSRRITQCGNHLRYC